MSTTENSGFEFMAQEPCFEFVSHLEPESLQHALPVEPGQVVRNEAGGAALLHFAPRRWLAPVPSPTLAAGLAALAGQGLGVLVDVEGKWRRLRAAGTGAARTLASTVDVEAILRQRECAAIALFDCPAILARRGDAFDVWIGASYADHLLGVIRSLRLPP